MMRVSNRKAVQRLAWRSFKANRIRNFFAIIAMILTSVLFTSLFTAAIGLNYTMQQQTMRMVGGSYHGNFKYLTQEQAEQLSEHPLIKTYGKNLILSALFEGDFAKHQAEIRYFDKNSAKMVFSYPTTGTLPVDKYDLATDTKALKILGVEPKLGEKVTITYPFGNKSITDTFTLCGFWETDELTPVSQVMLSKEYVERQLENYQKTYKRDTIATWDLEYMFYNSLNIEDKLRTIAEDKGYQIDDNTKDNYLAIGVNWAYTSAQMNRDYTIIFAVIAISLLILFAGYLIIYNIFLISVANDIRYYGLLKTIGTTGRQIKRMIRYQALLLSVLGIPVGLILGYFIGEQFTPLIMSSMSNTTTYQNSDPFIFLGATLFTIITVLISIRKPGRMAAKVSPMEAVRYTEGSGKSKKVEKQSKHGARIHRMAFSNLMRNKKKTMIVFISLSLSIVLLNSVYVFTKGFDTDKVVSVFMASDFTIASADYFNVQKGFRDEEDVPSEALISEVMKQEGIQESGRIYYDIKPALIDFTQEMIDILMGDVPADELDNYFYHTHGENARDGNIQLYGMDDMPLKKLKVVEGTLDIEKLKTGDYILESVPTDDYGNPFWETVFYHPGDKVELDYIDEMDYSGKRNIKHHRKTYEVMALVQDSLGLNVHYGQYSPSMILPSNRFLEDTKTSATMSYLLNAEDSKEVAIEKFLKNYTNKIDSNMSYDSKKTKKNEFEKYKNMFLIIGNSLSLVVGIIGILNYINVILTGIITRKREFSVLKCIGMTGKQLITMLMLEGLIYAGVTLIISAAISTLLNVTVIKALGGGLWFFTVQFSLLPVVMIAPILVLFGVAVPYFTYHITNKQSIVDQLREM